MTINKKYTTVLLLVLILFVKSGFAFSFSLWFPFTRYTAQTITIKSTRCLNQGGTADCGFYALYNALCLFNNEQGLLDKKQFKAYLLQAKRHLKNNNRPSTWIGSADIESLINNLDLFKPIRNNKVVIVDNIYEFDYALKHAKAGKLDPGFKKYYKNSPFTKATTQLRKGKTKVFITNLTSKNFNNSHRAGTHWIALKESWNNKKSAAITVTNSCGSDLSKHKTVTFFGDFTLQKPIAW